MTAQGAPPGAQFIFLGPIKARPGGLAPVVVLLLVLINLLVLLQHAAEHGGTTWARVRAVNVAAVNGNWGDSGATTLQAPLATAARPAGQPGVVAVLLPPITREWDERTAAARAAAAVATFADAVLVLGEQQRLFRSLLAKGGGGGWAGVPHLIDHGVPWGDHTGDTLNAAARAASQAQPDARWLFIARVDQNIQFVNGSASAISAQLRTDSDSLMLLCRSHGGIDAQGCFFRLPLKGSFAGSWGVTFVPHDPAASLVALASPTEALGLTISPAGVEETTPLGPMVTPITGDPAPAKRLQAACQVVERACCDGCAPPADDSASWALLEISRSMRMVFARTRSLEALATARRFCELAHEATSSRDLAAWAMYECARMAYEDVWTLNARASEVSLQFATQGLLEDRSSLDLAWYVSMGKLRAGDTRGALDFAQHALLSSACYEGNCTFPAQSAFMWLPNWWEGLYCDILVPAHQSLGMAEEVVAAARRNCSAAKAARLHGRQPLVTGLQAVALARGADDAKEAAAPSSWCPKAQCSEWIERLVPWEMPPIPWEVSRPYSQLAKHPMLSGSRAGGQDERCSGRGAPCSLLVAVPGMGGALLEKLLDIFWKNKHAVEARAAGVFDRVDWQVVSYNASQHEAVSAALSGGASRDAANVEVIFHQGLIGDHLRHGIRPEGYDFVFILLDDVELVQPIDWPVVMALQQVHDLDVMSGCSANSSASYIIMWCGQAGARPHDVVTLSKVRAVELYASVFTAAAFKQYRSWLAPYNPTLHGPEAMLNLVFGLNSGILPAWESEGRLPFAFHHHYSAWPQMGGGKATARYSDDLAKENEQRYYQDLVLEKDQREKVFVRFFVQAVFHYVFG